MNRHFCSHTWKYVLCVCLLVCFYSLSLSLSHFGHSQFLFCLFRVICMRESGIGLFYLILHLGSFHWPGRLYVVCSECTASWAASLDEEKRFEMADKQSNYSDVLSFRRRFHTCGQVEPNLHFPDHLHKQVACDWSPCRFLTQCMQVQCVRMYEKQQFVPSLGLRRMRLSRSRHLFFFFLII